MTEQQYLTEFGKQFLAIIKKQEQCTEVFNMKLFNKSYNMHFALRSLYDQWISFSRQQNMAKSIEQQGCSFEHLLPSAEYYVIDEMIAMANCIELEKDEVAREFYVAGNLLYVKRENNKLWLMRRKTDSTAKLVFDMALMITPSKRPEVSLNIPGELKGLNIIERYQMQEEYQMMEIYECKSSDKIHLCICMQSIDNRSLGTVEQYRRKCEIPDQCKGRMGIVFAEKIVEFDEKYVKRFCSNDLTSFIRINSNSYQTWGFHELIEFMAVIYPLNKSIKSPFTFGKVFAAAKRLGSDQMIEQCLMLLDNMSPMNRAYFKFEAGIEDPNSMYTMARNSGMDILGELRLENNFYSF